MNNLTSVNLTLPITGAKEESPSANDYEKEDSMALAGVCPPGHQCPEGTTLPEECAPGTLANTDGVS